MKTLHDMNPYIREVGRQLQDDWPNQMRRI